MLEQDYIVRMIKELVRTLLKLLFDIDMPNPVADLFQDTEENSPLQNLLSMADKGEINEAENLIYEMPVDPDKENLKTGLLFYAYINEKSDQFLEQHNFSREEVKQGIQYLVDKYGLNSITDTFLSDR